MTSPHQITQAARSGCGGCSGIEWVQTTSQAAAELADRAVVGGYETFGRGPLWVIRSEYECDMIPGKLAVQRQEAYVSWGEKEHIVHDIQVCCARPEDIIWVESSDGEVPPRAVIGGWTSCDELMYVGRAMYGGSLLIGKVHPSKGVLFMPYEGKEVRINKYEVLCTVR